MSIVGSPQWMYASGGFYGFDIENSLRFNDDDSAFLSRTPSSAGNREKWTLSFWIKRTMSGSNDMVFYAHGSSSNLMALAFNTTDTLYMDVGGVGRMFETNAVFRDPAAWYNFVVAFNTTDYSTVSAGQIKVYVNGVEQSFSSTTNMTQGFDGAINDAVDHAIGRDEAADNNYADHYLAEINLIDGTALDPSSFGETKENIWIPKDTSGLTFGTNGFRLQFKNSSVASASSSTVGADTSGNNHHFSSNNIATTDNMTDSPTDNFCTMNPIALRDNGTQSTLSDGNLNIDLGTPNTTVAHTYGTIAIPSSGKYFFEGTFSDVSGGPRIGISVQRTSANQSRYVYISSGQKIVNTTASSYGASYSASDVIGVAVNVDDNEITFFKNGSSQGAFTIDLTLSTGGSSSDYFPFITNGSGTSKSVVDFNFGQLAFTHTPPTGFVALSTANLPDPAIDPAQGENPTEYFNTVGYNGNESTNVITVGFQPDWVWTKRRNNTGGHRLVDSVRGVGKGLASHNTDSEQNEPNGVTSFDTNGFTLGSDDDYNKAAAATPVYVAWSWKAGTSFSNDASATGVGTIDSTGTVSTEAGFSVISYTGNGSAGASIAHGLGAVPEWIIVKNRGNLSGTENRAWTIYHSALGATKYIEFSTSAADTGTNRWNDTAPTSSVFTVGNGSNGNENGDGHIAYCFAPKEGFSKFGTYDDAYISNYDTDSPFVYTGFRPAWLMIKGTSDGREWVMYDNKRTPDNGVYLRANTSAAEQTDASNHDISFLSNGFKIRGGSGDINTTNESYIYMAFADQPFKFANGGTE
ncbi:hypothetical protein [uncultured Mediterranean phage uvMED]|nr:hypothetical protein [uncultured Mediterranean phage uvMED]